MQAIYRGVLDASIVTEAGAAGLSEDAWYMKTNDPVDVYSTEQPQVQFDERTAFCLEMHNAAVKAGFLPTQFIDLL